MLHGASQTPDAKLRPGCEPTDRTGKHPIHTRAAGYNLHVAPLVNDFPQQKLCQADLADMNQETVGMRSNMWSRIGFDMVAVISGQRHLLWAQAL
jgi:hypothetical protein